MLEKGKLGKLLKKRVVLGDGAMGTMLYEAGVFVNSCFDELNISRPEVIKKVHDAYVKAGVDFIETNTFGANEFKLGKFGLADEVERINAAAAQIAKESAGTDVLVAGAIGPLGREIGEYSSLTKKETAEAFGRQAKVLAEAGADFILLETFSSTDELLIAIDAVRAVTKLEIAAQITVTENNETVYGEKVEHAIERIAANEAVLTVGFNCSVGPAGMLSNLERVAGIVDKPISVQPNAGMPKNVDNRMLYMCTPEYMAEYAKRFFELGARMIGGCCGTTPKHIGQMVRAVRCIDKARRGGAKVTIAAKAKKAEAAEKAESAELGEKSELGRKIAAGEKVTMVELTPPRGVDLSLTIEKSRLCAEMGIDAINIPDGPRASSRMSPMVTAIRIQQEAGIETVLHFCCRDRNLIGMQSDMLGASAIGLKNMLIITGDPPKMGDYPEATGVFDLDSIALTAALRDLNCGVDIGGNSFSPSVKMAIGVGANPVATDMKREIERFRQKVEAGAEFAITQPVFDEDMLFRFLEAIEDFKIPVVAGIWPFTSFKNAEFMANEVPGVVVPEGILARMSKATTKDEGRKLGVEIAREMVEKIEASVAGFAVSAPFGNVDIALAVLGKKEF
ncbi:MAG: bifunctional homocysteine S-methyltransferase/methylenetetrahydrofolate reductase [Phycisphaerae bacterium]|nr:bifunctional homocysteine S-methyltransferase/methylenetetrahydrofolate reductase [Phycisphaerae bacterium]